MLMRTASSLFVNMKLLSPVPLCLLNLTTSPKYGQALGSEVIKHDGSGLATKAKIAGLETGFALSGGQEKCFQPRCGEKVLSF